MQSARKKTHPEPRSCRPAVQDHPRGPRRHARRPTSGRRTSRGPRRTSSSRTPARWRSRPGKYRLTFTRGPEYGAEVSEVVLAPGATRTVSAALRRIVDTSGYVSTDFHQHTILSADAPVGTRDRDPRERRRGRRGRRRERAQRRSPTSAPLVRELGMSRFLVSIPGDELTTDASKKPWGHANVFPLAADPSKPRGGAPPVRDRLAHDVLEEMRARPGPRSVLQVNHPRSGANGYFDQLAFDPKNRRRHRRRVRRRLRRARGVERPQRRRTHEGARRLPRAPSHEPSRHGRRRHRHARHRRSGGGSSAHVRSRREGRRARRVGRLAHRRARAQRAREARRGPHERPISCG